MNVYLFVKKYHWHRNLGKLNTEKYNKTYKKDTLRFMKILISNYILLERGKEKKIWFWLKLWVLNLKNLNLKTSREPLQLPILCLCMYKVLHSIKVKITNGSTKMFTSVVCLQKSTKLWLNLSINKFFVVFFYIGVV